MEQWITCTEHTIIRGGLFTNTRLCHQHPPNCRWTYLRQLFFLEEQDADLMIDEIWYSGNSSQYDARLEGGKTLCILKEGIHKL
ncbi:hypothetical protein [Sphingobacterium faecium]|uniref:hypothetical protein n=1 Tax=Sphingobacterium faecium TaxID=34087 RepID=UPI002468D6BC|nr:hypothetical protein [Sphingobacterium faecium]MDH5828744.1 hypothetical protein [Sphingobacterium faecium]